MAAKQVAANCILGAGSIFHGRLAVNGSLHIEGKFQGDIFTDGDVVVGPTGQAKTDITTRKVVVAGTFIGNIRASEEVYVMQSGKVLGSITTPKLTLEPGVVTSGNVTITSDQPDTVVDTVTSAYGADAEEAFGGSGRPLRHDEAG
jgi:cytoskeletal protein CcmA (bactofilin family)